MTEQYNKCSNCNKKLFPLDEKSEYYWCDNCKSKFYTGLDISNAVVTAQDAAQIKRLLEEGGQTSPLKKYGVEIGGQQL